MTRHGQFDTDATALLQRIQSHDRFGSHDINDWILDHLNIESGQRILDLGCGTGKQSLPMAERVGELGQIDSVDISPEGLTELAAAALARNFQDRVHPRICPLDNLDQQLSGESFDRVVGSYSLYYVNDPQRLFRFIRTSLNAEGLLFYCGPTGENNREIKRFVDSLKADGPRRAATKASQFMEETSVRIVNGLFRKVEILPFENPLRFNSPDALYAYWSAHNLYDATLQNEFRRAADAWFRESDEFLNVKRVVGVLAHR